MVLPLRDVPAVKARLDRLMESYGAEHLDSDPLGHIHRYRRKADREAAAFIAAALAFGNARAVRSSLLRVLGRLGGRPAEAVLRAASTPKSFVARIRTSSRERRYQTTSFFRLLRSTMG